MKISVKLTASVTAASRSFTIEQLDIQEDEWNQLNDEERQEKIKQAVYDLPDQPFWELDSWVEH